MPVIDPAGIQRAEAFAAAASLMHDVFVKAKQLGDRWGYSTDHLAQLRRRKIGIACVQLAATSVKPAVRYRLSDIVEAEVLGTNGCIDLERVQIAIATCSALTLDERAMLQKHVEQRLGPVRARVAEQSMGLPMPQVLGRHDAYAPIVALISDTLVKPKDLGARWGYSEDHLSNLRRRGLGLPYIRLPTGPKGKGGIRYRLSEIVAAEMRGNAGALTFGDVEAAITDCSDLSPEARLKGLMHVRRALGGSGGGRAE